MTEAWARSRAEADLVDREESPWDDPNRHPSHADKRRAWRRELLAEEIRAVLRPGVAEEEIQAFAELLSLAASEWRGVCRVEAGESKPSGSVHNNSPMALVRRA
jgi:hypothetical protein